MSYQVLARKWRPKSFEQLMGQEHVVTVLVNALNQQRLHHAYLFTGTRGVGKTTIARIFAKSLNCEQGITAIPCGKCNTCLEIDQGRFVDLLEIDAASKTKVDDTREILDNVQYAPTRGRYKVYLIDEVHMLSRHSFNALLKTLEEPPEHVKFILATTDPQKLPITVLSRCLQFHLKALTVQQIEAKLEEILEQEHVEHQSGTLTLLAKAARGSMRDSLSLTDQAIAQGQGNITLANIQQMLGGIDHNWVYKIVITLLKQDGSALIALSKDIASYAPSYNKLFADLIQLFHQIAMMQIVEQHFDLPIEQAELLKKFSQAISAQDIQLYYQIVLNGRKELPYAADEQAAFDMTLIRLLAFKPMQLTDAVPISTAALESQTNTLTPIDFNEAALANTQVTKSVDGTKTIESTKAVDSTKVIDEAITTDLNESNIDENVAMQSEQAFLPQQQSEESLTEQMQSIEQQAFEQGHNHLVDHIEPEVVTPEISLAETVIPESVTSEIAMPSAAILQKEPHTVTPVDAVLATRNMLRSRKKQLETKAKKPSDAISRHSTEPKQSVSNNATENITPAAEPAKSITPEPETPYQADTIDPAKVRLANQVDKWSHMIDSMALNGRIRQIAIHATISDRSTDDHLILKLDQATKHLNTENAHQQLQTTISEFLARNIIVTIEIVEQTVADPYQIQAHINDKRYDYAKALLLEDDIVQALQTEFQATIDEQTIAAR